MRNLSIRRNTLQKLHCFCTIELLQNVFKDFGEDNITIDEKNKINDSCDLGDFLYVEHLQLLDRLKVLYVFSYLGGQIFLQSKSTPYQTLFRLLNCDEPNVVFNYWLNNLYNDEIPVFGVGELNIPKVMPRFVCTEVSDEVYCVEKWIKGKYIMMKERYFNKELCEQRVQELNDKYEFKPPIPI